MTQKFNARTRMNELAVDMRQRRQMKKTKAAKRAAEQAPRRYGLGVDIHAKPATE